MPVGRRGKLLALLGYLVLYEDALEGSLWLHGTDLGAVYRGEMTLRKLRICIDALPLESPLLAAVHRDRLELEAKAEVNALDETLNMVRRQ